MNNFLCPYFSCPIQARGIMDNGPMSPSQDFFLQASLTQNFAKHEVSLKIEMNQISTFPAFTAKQLHHSNRAP